MRKVLSSLLFLFVVLSFTSCTNNLSLIVGVWEQDGFMKESGQRLVFASDHSGIKIIKNTDGELVNSSATSCNWEKDGDVITIYADEDTTIGVYSLNSEGQLISNNLDEIPFNKISDTTLDY